MKSIETSGKTVEDAIKTGLSQLNCDLADVQIDVQDQGSPGLFGMFGRLAKVRLTVKEDEPLIEMPVFSLDAQEEPKKKPKAKPEQQKPAAKPEPKPAPKTAPKPEPKPEPMTAPIPSKPAKPEGSPDAKPAERRPHDQKPKQPKPQRQPRPVNPAPVRIEMRDLEPLDVDKLTDIGRKAHEFLSNVTRLMNVPVEIRIEESDEQITIQMLGDELGVLIGRRGDTLDALQYLTSLEINRDQSKYVRVTLDTEHYRAKRADALTKLAGRMASRVAKTGHRVALEPMNPYERRILHSALQGHPNVTTHSEGEEPYRRVIITHK